MMDMERRLVPVIRVEAPVPDHEVRHTSPSRGRRQQRSPGEPRCGSVHSRPISERARRSNSEGDLSSYGIPSDTPNNAAAHFRAATLLEVRGFEPLCSGDHLGLLRAQPAYGSHLGVSTGGRPLGQPGCDVPRWSPGGTLAVSLLSDARTPTAGTRGGRLPRD